MILMGDCVLSHYPFELRISNEWYDQSMQYFIYKKKKKDFDILNQYPIIKKIFLKYNTMIQSSSPVEIIYYLERQSKC